MYNKKVFYILILISCISIFLLAGCISTASPGVKVKFNQLQSISGEVDEVLSLAFSPVDNVLALVGADQSLVLWDYTSNSIRRRKKAHGDKIFSVAYSPDGKLIATGSKDRTVKIWDTATLEQVHILKQHKNGVNFVLFSPDNKILATCGADLSIRLWSNPGFESLSVLTGHNKTIQALAFNTGSTELISAGSDKKVKRWDIGEDILLQDYKGANEILSLAFYENENKIISGNSAGNFFIWDTYSGKRIKKIKAHVKTVGGSELNAKIWGLKYNPELDIIASCAEDKQVKIWYAANYRLAQSIMLKAIPWCIDFDHTGKILAAGTGNGDVILYEASVQ